jgi:hypothetical protein
MSSQPLSYQYHSPQEGGQLLSSPKTSDVDIKASKSNKKRGSNINTCYRVKQKHDIKEISYLREQGCDWQNSKIPVARASFENLRGRTCHAASRF